MAEIHVLAVAREKLRFGDIVQVKMPVVLADGDELVLHITTTAGETHIATTSARPLGLHSPRTGLPH